MVALVAAMRTLSQAASSRCWFSSRAAYHLVENPAHTVTRRDSLKE